MDVHYGYENLNLKNSVVTVGSFDGLHRGHRYVIDMLKRRAQEIMGESVVVTFNPHPKKVVGTGEESLQLLTSDEEKIFLFRELNIDHLMFINFDRALSRMNANEFIEKILATKIGARHLLIGFNHHLGRMKCSYEEIKNIADRLGISSEILDQIKSGDTVISSSEIRKALLEGRLEEANNLLGYNYFMYGIIIGGRKIGRKLGYPTANIKPDHPDKLIPKNGVYAVEIILNEKKYPGVMSIGFNPTVNKEKGTRSIEVNILNFSGEIYGQKIRVIFKYRLRDEMNFGSLDELARQIEHDRNEALRLLKNGFDFS